MVDGRGIGAAPVASPAFASEHLGADACPSWWLCPRAAHVPHLARAALMLVTFSVPASHSYGTPQRSAHRRRIGVPGWWWLLIQLETVLRDTPR
jgi:hypothetical protein